MNVKPLTRVERPLPVPARLWAVILAGGEGVRLRPLARHVSGDDRPKQYVPLLGGRTLLEQTLDRVARLIPRERTVIVETRPHARYRPADAQSGRAPYVLVQPESRGTAAGILYPTHWIARRDPDAVVAVFPSDHFVVDEHAFMAHVAAVAAVAHWHPEHLILLGAPPADPETDYGWIEPGIPLDAAQGGPVFGVRQFREKPTLEQARAYRDAGWLWNTFIFVARASAFIAAGRETLPRLHERLEHLARFLDTAAEGWALRHAYAGAPTANFSRAVLESSVARLAVSPLPSVFWSDWGSPARVVASLSRAGLTTSWLPAWAAQHAAESRPQEAPA